MQLPLRIHRALQSPRGVWPGCDEVAQQQIAGESAEHQGVQKQGSEVLQRMNIDPKLSCVEECVHRQGLGRLKMFWLFLICRICNVFLSFFLECVYFTSDTWGREISPGIVLFHLGLGAVPTLPAAARAGREHSHPHWANLAGRESMGPCWDSAQCHAMSRILSL